jgi:hypothetical protein
VVEGNEENATFEITGSSGGNVQVYANSLKGGILENVVEGSLNRVGVNLMVRGNTIEGPTGSEDLVDISGNTVMNNLACRNDEPPATDTRSVPLLVLWAAQRRPAHRILA